MFVPYSVFKGSFIVWLSALETFLSSSQYGK